ncbi:hypothetical protein CcrC1_gp249c [Caulobacter phage C1]|nr:hypothetical protein CcrC1_gp249c [Caulobacter phage C1]UTU08478.1 hypothetical protein CcrC2_gp250c [Caulobacter phage C2]UTU08993.1 hypothetical protein CcrJ4_gp244c [Caulobacter phage J4]UTU09554.1 hypothetical protein CcrBL47_gp268c [Caulobacter phage BL47]UTU10111.1 hypothetical protein CcrRB23_gp249c [Caulobacter phage RB23]WGN97146.1 hypothetical protein [Bertelyvirus sp.]
MQIDVDITRVEPGLILARPITYGGRRWFEDNVSANSPMHQGAYVIAGESIDYFFDEMIEEGLVAF